MPTHVANYDALVRNFLGVLPSLTENEFEYQNMLDNVTLIDVQLPETHYTKIQK